MTTLCLAIIYCQLQKLDEAALLVKDILRANSTIFQNPLLCIPPLYIAIISEPINWLRMNILLKFQLFIFYCLGMSKTANFTPIN